LKKEKKAQSSQNNPCPENEKTTLGVAQGSQVQFIAFIGDIDSQGTPN